MRPEGLVGIGTFADAARMTVRALRHYHDEGVLRPAWVDPRTGYRWYSWDQLADALRITTLRELGVPLPTIRDHLAGGLGLRDLLAAERGRLRRQIEQARRALAVIDALEAGGDIPHHPVDTIRIGRVETVALAGVVPAAELGPGAARLIDRLLDEADRASLPTDEPVWGEYPVRLDGRVRVVVHLPVAPGAGPAAGRPGSALRRDAIPAGDYARVVHEGSLATLPLAYRSLLTSFAAAGDTPSGPVLERYVEAPGGASDDGLRTEVLHRRPGAR